MGDSPARTYVLLSLALAILMVGQTLNRLWSSLDFWVWLGPIREFSRSPFEPSHPLVAVSAPDSYMGPYSFFLGLVTRLTGADPVNVMAVAGLLNLVLVVVGLWQLTRRVSMASWAPPLALVFSLVAWGWRPWRWSGYLNLNSIGTVLSLGSTFAYGVGLSSLAAFWAWLDLRRDRYLLIATVTYPLALLTHQMTGLWVALVALGFVTAKIATFHRRDVRRLLAAAMATTAVLLLWPFYSVLELMTAVGGFDEINSATYSAVASRAALALPGLVILCVRARRDLRDPLALAALLVLAAFLFGWVTDRGSLGRVFPGAMLMMHLAMADWFAVHLSVQSAVPWRRRAVRTAFGAVCLLGLAGTATGWVRSVPRTLVPQSVAKQLRLKSYVEPNLAFVDYFEDDDIVAATGRASIPIAGVAAKVLSVGIPEPFIDDAEQRSIDVRDMLEPSTDRTARDALIAAYDPEWLVVEEGDAPSLIGQLPGAVITGKVNGFAVIRLPVTHNE